MYLFSVLTINLETSLLQFSESFQVNTTIVNCTFINNFASQLGVLLSFDNMRSNQNYLQILDNNFTNNTCNANGGLFSFVNVFINITAIHNSYRNNKAKYSGGVGFVYKSKALYFEDNGYYYS